MSVKEWHAHPTSEAQPPFSIDTAILQTFIELSQQDRLDNLSNELPATLIAQQSNLMTLPQQAWLSVEAVLSNEELLHLIRFFTLAESQLQGWEAGPQSPVIWLVKALRKRKAPPAKELLLWIKSHSDNRFLPNGAL